MRRASTPPPLSHRRPPAFGRLGVARTPHTLHRAHTPANTSPTPNRRPTFTDSTTPNVSPLVTVDPTSGSSTYTTSPSSLWGVGVGVGGGRVGRGEGETGGHEAQRGAGRLRRGVGLGAATGGLPRRGRYVQPTGPRAECRQAGRRGGVTLLPRQPPPRPPACAHVPTTPPTCAKSEMPTVATPPWSFTYSWLLAYLKPSLTGVAGGLGGAGVGAPHRNPLTRSPLPPQAPAFPALPRSAPPPHRWRIPERPASAAARCCRPERGRSAGPAQTRPPWQSEPASWDLLLLLHQPGGEWEAMAAAHPASGWRAHACLKRGQPPAPPPTLPAPPR